ncbi:hypothetical protein ACH5RR_036135 [Cinchona calisaya]|uniref:MFS transporter n=1 Tax=Cinchona calisaya TaxID=153742 RepID=A0ABD2Y4Q3_9GENT
MAFLRVMVLLWADMLAAYVMWIMPTYLTNVWKLGFTHAAGVMNAANGLAKVLPLVFFFFVDPGLGNYWMLLLSSIAYVILIKVRPYPPMKISNLVRFKRLQMPPMFGGN